MKNKALTLLIGLTAIIGQLHAADRALIIGITDYQQTKYQLPGIDLDVSMAEKIAGMLAFEKANTMTLTGPSATAANIKQAFYEWLIAGTQTNDRVFVYYSGHGGRLKDHNNDEEDGQDEYITAFDLGDSVNDGGYVLDDELSTWLLNIPATNKIIMLDSCHSGTATRSIKPTGMQMGENLLFSKQHVFGQAADFVRINKGPAGENSAFLDGHKNTIAMAAAHDFEAAQASQKGSLFTLGFFQALSKSTQTDNKATALQLVEEAGQFIAQTLANDPDYKHQPMIFGDFQLAQQPLLTKISRDGNGPNWQDLLQLSVSGSPMNAAVNQAEFAEGELIQFSLDLPVSGFLNIVNVDAHDEVTVIYPNQFNLENSVSAGTLKIPENLMPFEIEASLPAGESLTVFILTSEPLNLYQQDMNVRNGAGEFVKNFAGVSEHAYRSMKVRAREREKYFYTAGIKTSVK
jgi:hypothetical protein